MPSPWRHSIWNANAESWESRGGNSFAIRIYLHSLVYLPSTTSSDIVASPSLATSPDCRTAPQHIKLYSLTSTSHSVVFPIPPGVVGLVAHVADGSTKSETTPARHLSTSWRQALGCGHRGRATRRPTLALQWWWWWWMYFSQQRINQIMLWSLQDEGFSSVRICTTRCSKRSLSVSSREFLQQPAWGLSIFRSVWISRFMFAMVFFVTSV